MDSIAAARKVKRQVKRACKHARIALAKANQCKSELQTVNVGTVLPDLYNYLAAAAEEFENAIVAYRATL